MSDDGNMVIWRLSRSNPENFEMAANPRWSKAMRTIEKRRLLLRAYANERAQSTLSHGHYKRERGIISHSVFVRSCVEIFPSEIEGGNI